MSVRSAARLNSVAAPVSARRRQQASRRRLTVYALRLAVAVVVLGGWELGARVSDCNAAGHLCVVDKFFWSQPSDIWATLWRWFTQGTELGPLWQQVLATLQETVGGFVVGSVLGIVFGVALGRNRLLSDVL